MITRVNLREPCITLALNLTTVPSIPSLLPLAVMFVMTTPPGFPPSLLPWGVTFCLHNWGASNLLRPHLGHIHRYIPHSFNLVVFGPYIFRRRCWPSSIILPHTQFLPMPSSAPVHLSWLLIQGPQIICSPTDAPSSLILQCKDGACVWGTTPLLPSWVMAWQLFLSTVRRSSCGTASMSLTSATLSTASGPINDSADVVLLECMAWVCTSSSLHSFLKWTPPPTVICNMPIVTDYPFGSTRLCSTHVCQGQLCLCCIAFPSHRGR
jgi:hypothetical protein